MTATTKNYVHQTETVDSVKSRQVIWAEWMVKATQGLTADDLVETITFCTPFGDYLMGINKISK